MKICRLNLWYVTGILVLGGALSASAISFNFYKLGNGAGDFVPENPKFASNSDWASSDVGNGSFGGALTFISGGITATATGTYDDDEAAVVQDHETTWSLESSAGLGVYHVVPLDTSDDNITSLEELTITFDQVVTLTSISLRAEGHNYTGWVDDATFLFQGLSSLLPKGTGVIDGLSLTGTEFTFAFNDAAGAIADQFYLAGMTVTTPVPDGGLTLAFMGLSLLGLSATRRRLGAR